MPTPFMHLEIAEQIKARLREYPEKLHNPIHFLDAEWSAFYFGSVAPDYQVLCGVPREVTHFYKMPPDPDNQAYPRMLSRYPELFNGHNLPLSQAVFVAAYAAHLMLDLVWFREVIIPMFHDRLRLSSRQERGLLHMILLTYLDKLAYEALPDEAGSVLANAKPNDWLPFARDEQLWQWRDFLVPQLMPEGKPLTVEIYAERLQMTAVEFAAKLDDRAWLQDNLFDQIPVSTVQEILGEAVPASIRLISDYLDGKLV